MCVEGVKRFGLGVLLLASLLAAPGMAHADGPPQVYLIQNSGWMESFYTDPTSQLKPLVGKLIQQTASKSTEITIATFNQNDRPYLDQNGQLSTISPQVLYNGAPSLDEIQRGVNAAYLPYKPDRQHYTDADYTDAVTRAIHELLHDHPGVIWMVTNDKSSPNNDPNFLENTQKFSDLLSSSDNIPRITAYPIRMPTDGPKYSEPGLVVYAIAFGGQPEKEFLASLVSSVQLTETVKGNVENPAPHEAPVKPVRLKPLTEDPLRFDLSEQAPHGIWVEQVDGRLKVHGLSESDTDGVSLSGTLTSDYYPQIIDKSDISAEWQDEASGETSTASINPPNIQQIGPGQTIKNVEIHLKLPRVTRPSGIVGYFTPWIEIPGTLEIKLEHMNLKVESDFYAKMWDICPTDRIGLCLAIDKRPNFPMKPELPNIFFDHQRVNSATTYVPTTFIINLSPWPLIGLVTAVIAALVGLIGSFFVLNRPRPYAVKVGMDVLRVRIKPFQQMVLQDQFGTRAQVVGRPFGQPRVKPLP